MNRGRLEQLGTPEEIYGAPRSRFVAEFVGLSNFLEGRVEAVIGAEMTVAVGTLRVRAVAAPGVAPGQRVLLFVRPNEVVLAAGEAETTRGGLPGRVDKATYLGDKIDYRVALGEGVSLRVQADARQRLAPGTAVILRLPTSRTFVADAAGRAAAGPAEGAS